MIAINAQTIINNKHLRVLAAKKEVLKDSVVFLNLNEDTYGDVDSDQMEDVAKTLESIEPSGCYILNIHGISIDVYERGEIRNKNLKIAIKKSDKISTSDRDEMEQVFRDAFKDAKDIEFVYLPDCDIKIV